MSIGVRLTLLAMLLSLAACGRGEDTVTVSGVLRQTGGPFGVSQPGVPGTVTFRSSARTIEAEAAEDGTFSLRLPASTYKVEGRSPTYGGGRGICRADPLQVGSQPVRGLLVACSRR